MNESDGLLSARSQNGGLSGSRGSLIDKAGADSGRGVQRVTSYITPKVSLKNLKLYRLNVN